MLVRFEDGVRTIDLSTALDVDVLSPVHHDLSNSGVGQKRFQRPQAQYLRDDLLKQPLSLRPTEDNVLVSQDVVVHLLNRATHLIRLGDIHRRIQIRDQLILDACLEVQIGVLSGRCWPAPHAQLGHPRRSRRGHLLFFLNPFQQRHFFSPL